MKIVAERVEAIKVGSYIKLIDSCPIYQYKEKSYKVLGIKVQNINTFCYIYYKELNIEQEDFALIKIDYDGVVKNITINAINTIK